MSNKRKLPRVGPGFGELARQAHPGYVTPDAICDVPDCGGSVGGDRTVTFVAEDMTTFSVLCRLCAVHTDVPHAELLRLLPALREMADSGGPAPVQQWSDVGLN